MKKKWLLLILCAVFAGSALESRRGGGGRRGGGMRMGGHRGGRGGFHRGGGRRRGGWHGGHRGRWGGRGWGGYGLGFGLGAPWYGGTTEVIVQPSVTASQRPAGLDDFIVEYRRRPRSVDEFCSWVGSSRQCRQYRAYRNY